MQDNKLNYISDQNDTQEDSTEKNIDRMIKMIGLYNVQDEV